MIKEEKHNIEIKSLKEEKPKHQEKGSEPRPSKEIGPKHQEERPKPKLLRKEEPELPNAEPLILSQEEIEVIINLCGSKRELADALNHINRMVLEAPQQVKSEIKIKKLK